MRASDVIGMLFKAPKYEEEGHVHRGTRADEASSVYEDSRGEISR